MARLQPFMRDLNSPEGRLHAAKALMDHVYGVFDPAKHSRANWQPRPLADTKSRYLWTDAFGVVNFISLAAREGNINYLTQAEILIESVHNVLGRERPGGHHCQWLPGASEAHPTRGGLRIGKTNEEDEPDGDGQYFHYLTKWCFALNRMYLATDDEKYNKWAVELLEAAHPAFVRQSTDPINRPPKMYWKTSIDMKRPMVTSEGNLDPFDGLVTVRLVKDSAPDPSATLAHEEADFAAMVAAKWPHYSSSDPLDLGEALWLSHWELGEKWANEVSDRSADALDLLWESGYFQQPPGYRLAFREFGTTLGFQTNPRAFAHVDWGRRIDTLHSYWSHHVLDRDQDISPVMLAASLVPGAWAKHNESTIVGLASRLKRLEH